MTDSTLRHYSADVTGSQPMPSHKGSIIVYPVDRYEVLVNLSDSGEFLGITEVRVNKDFRSLAQRMKTTVHFDVARFYEE